MDRSWFHPEEIDELFHEIKTSELSAHLVFVEKVGSKYTPLLIVSPPCKQGHALSSCREEWRQMFTDMVEIPLGSHSFRETDRGPHTNDITMWGYRWTRNFEYCYSDKCVGPFTLSPAALRDVRRLSYFEISAEKFATRLGMELEYLSPQIAELHRTHIGEFSQTSCCRRNAFACSFSSPVDMISSFAAI